VRRLAESPLFWLALFSGTALVCLVVIWSKYTQRQRRIEANYRMRESLMQGDGPRDQPAAATDDEQTEPDLIRSLRPLVVVLAAVFLISIVGLAYRYVIENPKSKIQNQSAAYNPPGERRRHA
jgi:hypothetical protein